MNRIILIGNGFDLAHGLKTSYNHFIDWYWEQLKLKTVSCRNNVLMDQMCCIELNDKNFTWSTINFYLKQNLAQLDGHDFRMNVLNNSDFFTVHFPDSFFRNIHDDIETKGWVDIENVYYNHLKKWANSPDTCEVSNILLNQHLAHLRSKLIEYLCSININTELIKEEIRNKFYCPINRDEISIKGNSILIEYLKSMYEDRYSHERLQYKLSRYGKNHLITEEDITDLKMSYATNGDDGIIKYIDDNPHSPLLLPDNILILNFNYTDTEKLYYSDKIEPQVCHIHGTLTEKNSVIFGYGDELDEDYKKIVNQNNNEYLKYIKSIRYMESDNYRKVLSFIESDAYQVCIMGHSCGNSDRTLLNTLFEHKNCISVMPYYYKKDDGTDNYLELVQNISRNFTDMKLMRDRVVNKQYCKTLTN